MNRETAPKEGEGDPSLWLIEQIQAGIDPEENLRRLHELHYRRVVNFFLRKGFSPEESRDLTQDVFLRVFRGIGGFRRESRFERWLFEIANNVLGNEMRRWSDYPADDPREDTKTPTSGSGEPVVQVTDPPKGDGDSELDEAVDEERLWTLRQALAELPPRVRLCCELRYVRGYKDKEIATLMKVTTQTVKAYLQQAREHLKMRLTDTGGKG